VLTSDDNYEACIEITQGILTLFYNFSSLTEGLSYQFEVWANNAVGEGIETSISVDICGLPEPPTSITDIEESRASGEITLSWAAPTITGGCAITAYNVYQDGLLFVSDYPNTELVVSGLTQG
jgi:titin